MSEAALKKVMDHAAAGLTARKAFFDAKAGLVVEIARAMAVCLASGGKVMFCGNGGSAADSQHLAAEFTNRFRLERPPLPGLALTTDTSALTAIGNDYSFDEVFSKQLQALGRPGDILVGLSTSGTSANVIRAMREARRGNIVTVGLSGQSGGEMTSVADFLVTVPSTDTAVIQEIHIAAGHMLCHLVDHFLFEAVAELTPYLPQQSQPSDSMRTLIVEDTLINQEFLRMIMSPWGECQVADCGELAVDFFAGALETAPFDIVFMDVMLPGIDGLQTLERIRALEQSRGILPADGIKAIITTALDEAERATQLGTHGHPVSCLSKPVRQDAVERELRKFGLIG